MNDGMRSSSSFITLIRQMSTCRLLSTQNLTLLLHLRSGSICSGTLPNPWEGERWIITQVLFGYGLDVTSIPRPVPSAEQRAAWIRVQRCYCGLYCFCHWQLLHMSKLQFKTRFTLQARVLDADFFPNPI